jgi:hypothetical protein
MGKSYDRFISVVHAHEDARALEFINRDLSGFLTGIRLEDY